MADEECVMGVDEFEFYPQWCGEHNCYKLGACRHFEGEGFGAVLGTAGKAHDQSGQASRLLVPVS